MARAGSSDRTVDHRPKHTRAVRGGWFVAALIHAALLAVVTWLLRAHWITIVVAAIAGPFTALTPFLSVGIVATITEALVRRLNKDDFASMSKINSIGTAFNHIVIRLILLWIVLNLVSAMFVNVGSAAMRLL